MGAFPRFDNQRNSLFSALCGAQTPAKPGRLREGDAFAWKSACLPLTRENGRKHESSRKSLVGGRHGVMMKSSIIFPDEPVLPSLDSLTRLTQTDI